MTITNPVIANTGNSFILLGVRDIKTLAELKPDHALIEVLSEKFYLIAFYVFTRETNVANKDVSARMFAPRYGIKEESATSMAAGLLACYLYDHFKMEKSQFFIEQGYSMETPSPSCIEVSLSIADSAIKSLLAGGTGAVSRHEIIEM